MLRVPRARKAAILRSTNIDLEEGVPVAAVTGFSSCHVAGIPVLSPALGRIAETSETLS